MIKLKGVSTRIDDCTGLIAKKAIRNYRRLNPIDKRWIDPEDVLQESLMAACEAESTFEPFTKKKPAIGPVPQNKFSTYLYTGLDYGLNRVLHMPLQQKKRDSSQIFLREIDRPMWFAEYGFTTYADTMAAEEEHPSRIIEVAQDFLELCSVVTPEAFLLLVEGFLIGSWTGAGTINKLYWELLEQIRIVCENLEIRFEDLNFLLKNESARIFVLDKLSKEYSMRLGKDVEAGFKYRQARLKVLVCRECKAQFSLDAIAKGEYFVSTYTCKKCFDDLASSPSSVSCFGKLKIVKPNGTVKQEGYSAKDIECQLHCTDRKICHQYVSQINKEEQQMPQTQTSKAKAKMPPPSLDEVEALDVEDLDTDEPEIPVKKSKKTLALGKKKAAPVEEAEEPEEEEEESDDEEDDTPAEEDDLDAEVDEPEEDGEEELEAAPEEEEEEEAAPVKAKSKKSADKKKVAAKGVKASSKAAPAKSAKASSKAAPAKSAKATKDTKSVKAAGSAKASKKAAPAKKAKAKSSTAYELKDLYPAPAELGGRWPHKQGSVMRYCFQRAYKGVKAADLQAEVEKFGRNWPLMLKVMNDGYAGKQRTTHRWKLNQAGGRLKIENVQPQTEHLKKA